MKFAKHKKIFAVLMILTLLVSSMSAYASGVDENKELVAQEENQQQNQENAENEKTPEATKPEAAQPEAEEAKETEKTEKEDIKEEAKPTEEDTKSEKATDVNAPVIEKVELDKQGQTVDVGDKVVLTVEAYDADSAPDSVLNGWVTIGWNNDMGPAGIHLEHKGGKTYQAEYTVPEVAQGRKCQIKYGNIYDGNGNSADIVTNDAQGKPLYYFQVSGTADTTKPVIKNVNITQQGQTLKPGDKVQVSIEATDINGIHPYGWVYFSTREANNSKSFSVNLQYNNETKCMEGEATIHKMISGKWSLNRVDIQDLAGNQSNIPGGLSKHWFMVSDPDEDREKPVIKSIELDKQGEVVKLGQQVTLQVEVTDNKKIRDVSASMNSGLNNGSGTAKHLPLTHKGGNLFEAVIEIEQTMQATEWYISGVSVSDEYDNYAYVSDYLPNFSSTYPYYFYVGKGGSTTFPTLDFTVNFIGLDGKGNNVTLKTKKYEEIEKRSLLKDVIKEDYPDPATSYEGLKFLYWVDSTGKKVEDGVEILNSGWDSISIYAVYDKSITPIWYSYIDKDGKRENLERTTKIYSTGTTYGEILKDLEKRELPKDNYDGITASKWTLEDSVDMDAVPPWGYGIRLIPDYDKSFVSFNYESLDERGKWIQETENKLFPKGTTIGEAIEEGKEKVPTQYQDVIFGEWRALGNGPDSMELRAHNTISMQAAYDEYSIIQLGYSYTDTKGNYQYVYDNQVLKKGTYDFNEVMEKASEKVIDGHYPKLNFEKWSWYKTPYPPDNTSDFISNHFNAEYDKYIVRLVVDEQHFDEADEYAYSQIDIVEKGSEYTLPKKVTGFKDIEWEYNWDQNKPITVNSNTIIYGIGVKDANVTPDPEPTPKPDPKPEPKPEPNPTPNPAPNPGTPLPPQEVEDKKNEIAQNPGAGESVVIDMAKNGATQIPKDILKAAQGKNTNLVLNMGGYTWTINGRDILASDLKDINLEVKTNANAIPNKLISAIAGDNPVQQLSLTHNGDFGFKATLTVNVGKEYHGKYGNLFYHDSSGKMVYMNAGSIDADGNVSLGFSHASDYAIVIADKVMDPGGKQGVPGSQSPKTGDTNSVALYIGIMGAALLALGAVKVYKKKKVNN